MKILDFTLLRCPVPLVQTKLFVKNAEVGTRCRILLSDPGSIQDVPAILKKMGHLVEIQTDELTKQVTVNLQITKRKV
ncbi:MAG: sulfurtransferase TusA family protein [Psychrobium sp.]